MNKEEAANQIYIEITKYLDATFKGATMIPDSKDGSWIVYGRFIINKAITFEDLQKKMSNYGFKTILPKRRFKDSVTFVKNYK